MAKQLIIKIDDDAYEDIKTDTGVKIIRGNLHGPLDEFVLLFIKSVDAGKNVIHITKRKKGRRRQKI
jgi:hypothetical protein